MLKRSLALAPFALFFPYACAQSGASDDSSIAANDAGALNDAAAIAHEDGSTKDAASTADAAIDAGPPPHVGLQSTTGWQVYPDGSYHYGPSILVEGGTIHMWTCSPGSNGAWDYIRYHASTDGGHTWSADVVALEPTAGSMDAYSTCDPGAVKIGSYYYVGYTSTLNSGGIQNDVFIARSTSPTGPFDKWNGASWGGNPAPIETYPHSDSYYGYGEPSLVLVGKKIFVYYSDDEATQYTNLATSDDATVDDWPLHLVEHGHAITRDRSGQDSADVKYVDSLGIFFAVSTCDRFTSNGSIAAYQSNDGITFTPSPFLGARTQIANHNVGISGDASGHFDTTAANFISYAYQPLTDSWGNWPTFLDPITLGPKPEGTPVAGEVSSIVGTNDWNWSGPRAWDGDPTTVFSSVSHAATDVANEWAMIDLGAVVSVTGVTITPRATGYGFPVDFSIQTSADASTWTDVPGENFTGYPNPGSTPAAFNFASVASTRYLRVNATRLGVDDAGNHYLQLAEIDPVIAK